MRSSRLQGEDQSTAPKGAGGVLVPRCAGLGLPCPCRLYSKAERKSQTPPQKGQKSRVPTSVVPPGPTASHWG